MSFRVSPVLPPWLVRDFLVFIDQLMQTFLHEVDSPLKTDGSQPG